MRVAGFDAGEVLEIVQTDGLVGNAFIQIGGGTDDVRLVMADTRGIVSDIRAGRCTIGNC